MIPVTCPICQGSHYASTCTSKAAVEADRLAALAAGGDREALAELYTAYQGTVLDLVDGLLRGTARAHREDAAQDVWVEVCEWIGLVEPGGFVDWLVLLAGEVAERYNPLLAPVSKAAKQTRRVSNPFANPLRLASMRLAVAV